MKRIHVKPKPLPRIVRIALCVLAAAVLLFVVYPGTGFAPGGTARAYFHARGGACL